jgi:hypothetical protein
MIGVLHSIAGMTRAGALPDGANRRFTTKDLLPQLQCAVSADRRIFTPPLIGRTSFGPNIQASTRTRGLR